MSVPVPAVGGGKSFGTNMAAVMRFAASDVEEEVVPGSGYWIMEENPKLPDDRLHEQPVALVAVAPGSKCSIRAN